VSKPATAQIGTNRTGMGTSPIDGPAMIEGATAGVAQPPPGGEGSLARARVELARSDTGVGSVPPPSSVKGVVEATVQAVQGKRPAVLVDKLGERLAFERSGTRLYDGLLAKLDASAAWPGGPSRDELVEHREDELRHARMLEDVIESLGADPTVETPCADVSGVASMGLLQVVADPRTTLPQCLEAVLTAELTDAAGWELLIELARAYHLDDAVEAFEAALDQEQHHVESVRAWLSAGVLRDAA
jgi:ferritin-like metal-binding protein YciE